MVDSSGFLRTAKKRIRCPRCGFEFSMVYGRALACQGCRKAATGCPNARCVKCDFEFPITKIFFPKELRKLAKVYVNYYNQFGLPIGR